MTPAERVPAIKSNKRTKTSTQSYQEAYERLSQIAAELEDGQTDLDRALPLLTEAQAAYALCQDRIAQLQAMLDKNEVTQRAEEEFED